MNTTLTREPPIPQPAKGGESAAARPQPSYPFRLPVVLISDSADEQTQYAVTEEIGRGGFAVLLDEALTAGSGVMFFVASPLGDIRGNARVIHAEPRRLAGQLYTYCQLEFLHFDDQGRVTLDDLTDPRKAAALRPFVRPHQGVKKASLRRPLLIFGLVMIPLVVVAMLGFPYIYRDYFFLRDLANGRKPLGEANVARLEQIYNSAMTERYASNDELVLLMGALTAAKKEDEIDQVTLVLAPRDPHNLDLQIALAQSLDDTRNFEQAEKHYQQLIALLKRGKISEAKRREVLLAAARNRVHAGKMDKAIDFFNELLRMAPDDLTLRNEFAGALLAGEKYAEVIELYKGVTPDLYGHLQQVMAYTQMENFDAAEKECRAIVALRPDDKQAQLLLADVLSWKKGGYAQARAIYDRLASVNGEDPELQLRLAQISLWSKHYPEALSRFQALFDTNGDVQLALKNKALVKGWVDAASSIVKNPEDAASRGVELTEAQRRTANVIYRHVLTGAADDAVLLARLAWVMQCVKQPDASAQLLDRAARLNPTNPEVRRQFFGALIVANRLEDALRLFKDEEFTVEERRTLIGFFLKNNKFEEAATQCRRILERLPDDYAIERQLADILSWKKEYVESLRLFTKLLREHPADPELPVRVAEVMLWSGDFDQALARFESMLASRFDRPELWADYVDAASGSKADLTPKQKQLVLNVNERVLAGVAGKPEMRKVSLARLAWALVRCDEKAKAEAVLDRARATPPATPDDRKELAGVLAALKRFQEAARLFDGVEVRPQDRLEVARIQLAGNDLEGAEKQCRAMIQDDPKHGEARRLLAAVLSWKRDFPTALALLDQLIDESPQDMKLRASRAEVLVWSGAYDQALEQLKALLDATPDQHDLWRAYVDAAASAKNAPGPEHERMLLRIYEANLRTPTPAGDKAVSLPRLAWVLWRMDQKPKATALLERLKKEQFTGATDRDSLWRVLTATGRFDDAREMIEKMLQEAPDNPELLGSMANLLLWTKRYPEALGYYEKALDKKFEMPDLDLWTGFVDAAAAVAAKGVPVTKTQAELAVKIYERNKEVDQRNATFASRLAWVLHKGKQDAPARALLEKLLALKPTDLDAIDQLAGLLSAVGRADRALELYEPLAQKDPNNPQVQSRMAELTLSKHDYDQALDNFEKLLSKNFEQPNLWKGFVAALANASVKELTEERYRLVERIAERLDPVQDNMAEQAEALTSMAWALLRLGAFDRAGVALDRAIAAAPSDAEVRRNQADILTAVEKFADALPIYEKLSDELPDDEPLKLRVAEVTLWCRKDYDKALARFQAIITGRKYDPARELGIWKMYIDAAAMAEEVTDPQVKLAQRIGQQRTFLELKDAAYLSRLAWVLFRGNAVVKANALADQAVALKPKRLSVRKELAGVLTTLDRFGDAVKIYESLLKEHPEDDELPVLAAEAQLGGKDYATALARFQEMLAKRFDDPEAWRGYASAVAMALGKQELTPVQRQTLTQIADAVKRRGSTDAALLCRLAWDLLATKADKPSALQFLDLAIAAKPKKPELRKELANILAGDDVKSYKQAIALYKTVELDVDGHRTLAKVYAADQQFTEAQREMEIVHKARPADPADTELYGDVLAWNKKYTQAIAIYNELIRQRPNDAQLPVKLAQVTLWKGDFDDAFEKFCQLLAKNPDQPELWRDYVDAASGKLSRDFEASKKKQKDNPEASGKDPSLAVEPHHRQMMRQVYAGLMGSGKPDPELLGRLAWVLRLMKEKDRGITALQRAVKQSPKSRELRLQLAEALLDVGRSAEAEDLFNGLLQTPGAAEGASPAR